MEKVKTKKNIVFSRKSAGCLIYSLFLVFGVITLFSQCKKEEQTPDTKISGPNLFINATEEGSDIYLNGRYTGKTTPDTLKVPVGTYKVGVGLKNSRNYLRRTIEISNTSELFELELNKNDLQTPKTWKALFVGINDVSTPGSNCSNHYTTAELDLAFDYFKWSFREKAEPYSYHTMEWEFTRKDISDQTVMLNANNYLTPQLADQFLTDVKKGDYDLIVTFFKGTDQNCFDAGFLGLAWYWVTELNCDASYYMIRYHEDLENRINYAKNNDPGVFVHEWLHTVAEDFFPNKGIEVPKLDNGEVVHAAEKYGYSWPWMFWYRDLISGQVKDGDKYVGIGPDAFLECTVSESALGQCP